MEVKLSLRQRPPELRLPPFQSKSNFPSYSLLPKSWENGDGFFEKRIRGTVKKWRLRLQEISASQCSAKNYLVHFVKEGETLTSISKQYGVSIYAIAAANKNIANIDLVYEGQHLNVPFTAKRIQVGGRSRLANFKLLERILGPLNISAETLHPKNIGMLYSHSAPHVYPSYYQGRSVGWFLILVPLIAFCIRFIVGAIHARASRESRQQGVDDSGVKHHRLGGGRWKSALRDAWEPDSMDVESIPDSAEVKENHSEDPNDEEEYHAYRKLESDYQEFLSQCGMSKFGYWRGGTSR